MTVRVQVPATSANLGPGFDTLGLALGLWDEIEVNAVISDRSAVALESVEISVDGVGADEVPRDETHLVVRAIVACLAEVGRGATHIRLVCRNRIPHGRGLGSSAAAIVAGVLAARALAGATRRYDDAALLALAGRLEGHPDNVAPCLLGGLTVAWSDDGGAARAIRDEVHTSVRPVVFVPDTSVKTEVARGLLPSHVTHADAAHNAGRAALLVEALTRRPDVLYEATDDRLHQVYREPAMRGTIELMSALRQEGQAAVISGAGPSVLVLTSDPGSVREAPSGWSKIPLDVAAGACVNGRREMANDAKRADNT